MCHGGKRLCNIGQRSVPSDEDITVSHKIRCIGQIRICDAAAGGYLDLLNYRAIPILEGYGQLVGIGIFLAVKGNTGTIFRHFSVIRIPVLENFTSFSCWFRCHRIFPCLNCLGIHINILSQFLIPVTEDNCIIVFTACLFYGKSLIRSVLPHISVFRRYNKKILRIIFLFYFIKCQITHDCNVLNTFQSIQMALVKCIILNRCTRKR